MRKKAVVSCLNSQYFYARTEERCGVHHSRCPGLEPRIESVSSLTLTTSNHLAVVFVVIWFIVGLWEKKLEWFFFHAMLNSVRVVGREVMTCLIMVVILVYSNNSSLRFVSGISRHLCSLLASLYVTWRNTCRLSAFENFRIVLVMTHTVSDTQGFVSYFDYCV